MTSATRSAKKFLIGQILIEADRENVSLFELERKMLEFSEAEKTPQKFAQLNAEFENEYDTVEYEEKIAGLIRNRIADLCVSDSPEYSEWNEAVNTLAQEDHYLLVLIDNAKSLAHRTTRKERPPHDRLKLIATAAAIAVTLVILFLVADSLGILPR